jgi:uncharacterized protein
MNSETEPEVKYLENIILPLLQFPDDFNLARNMDERGIYLVLRVNQADMGVLIGRQGQTAQAIRTLLRSFGGINQKSISLKIDEPAGSKRPRPENFGNDREMFGTL